MANTFERLSLRGWRQFADIDIEFHPRLTIITGPNGTGKSTIMSILNRHFGYTRKYYSTPSSRSARSRVRNFVLGLFRVVSNRDTKESNENAKGSQHPIGDIVYSDGSKAQISVNTSSKISYDIQLQNQMSCPGVHIDSHRPPNIYGGISNIPMAVNSVVDLTNPFEGEFRSYYSSGKLNQGSLFHMKNALIAMSVHGHGNPNMDAKPEFLDAFNRFVSRLRILLPKSIGFNGLQIRGAEVILKTQTGDFIIDASSGGVIKLFEIAWQLFFFAEQNKDGFVVTIDEPENHLHPSLQRTFLSDLLEAFPEVQFVVVTHSPFIVSSTRNSECYVLRSEALSARSLEEEDDVEEASDKLRIFSSRLDVVNKAGTATEILREVLGVPTTIPDWAEDRVNGIIREMRGNRISGASLDDLYQRLEVEGLISEYPRVVKELSGKQ